MANVAIGLIADEIGAGKSPIGDGPRVFVSTDDIVQPCRFTGPELRRLAAALLNAADEWDMVSAP